MCQDKDEISYQSTGFIIMKVYQRADVTLSLPPPGVHKLLGLLIAELHVVSTATPLPLDPLGWANTG